MANPVVLGIVVVYMALVVLIGVWASRRQASAADFYVSGWNAGPWIVAFSTCATTASGFFYVGLPGLAYNLGYQVLISLPVNAILAYVVAYGLLAKPMRYVSQKYNALTVPDLFQVAYDSRAVRLAATVIILIGTFTYLVSQWVATGVMFQTLLGSSYILGLLIGVAIVGFYCSLGGQTANMYNDSLQMIVMMAGAILAVIIGFSKVGGFTEMNVTLGQVKPQMLLPFSATFGFSLWMFLSWWLVYAVGYVGQPQVTTRFMTIKRLGLLRWAPAISASAYFIITLILFTGMLYRVSVVKGMAPALKNPDMAMPQFLLQFAPPWISGVVISAGLAAIMSTVSTFLLVAASALIRDLLEQGLGYKMDARRSLKTARIGTVILAVISLFLALKPLDLVAFLGNIAFGFFAAALGPALVAAFRWRRATWQGALTSMIVGGGLEMILAWLKTAKIIVMKADPGAIAFLVSIGTLVVVSLITRPQERTVLPRRQTAAQTTVVSAD